MKLRITDWLMKVLGAPEPKTVFNRVEAECEEWNTLYAYGKQCEKCGCEGL
jgi:hypothetical protein